MKEVSLTRKAELLLKPTWTLSDIQEYCGCSKVTAENIRDTTQALYGVSQMSKGNSRIELYTDDVLDVLGEIDRKSALEIIKLYKEVVEE